jgi:hypothetical protein
MFGFSGLVVDTKRGRVSLSPFEFLRCAVVGKRGQAGRDPVRFDLLGVEILGHVDGECNALRLVEISGD